MADTVERDLQQFPAPGDRHFVVFLRRAEVEWQYAMHLASRLRLSTTRPLLWIVSTSDVGASLPAQPSVCLLSFSRPTAC